MIPPRVYSLNIFFQESVDYARRRNFPLDPHFHIQLASGSVSQTMKRKFPESAEQHPALTLHKRLIYRDDIPIQNGVYHSTLDGIPSMELAVKVAITGPKVRKLHREFKTYLAIRARLSDDPYIEPITPELHGFAFSKDRRAAFLIMELGKRAAPTPFHLLEYDYRLAVFRLGFRLHNFDIQLTADRDCLIQPHHIVLCGGRPRFVGFSQATPHCTGRCERLMVDLPDDRSHVATLNRNALAGCLELHHLGLEVTISRYFMYHKPDLTLGERLVMTPPYAVVVKTRTPSPYGPTWDFEYAPRDPQSRRRWYYDPEEKKWKVTPEDWREHKQDFIFDSLLFGEKNAPSDFSESRNLETRKTPL